VKYQQKLTTFQKLCCVQIERDRRESALDVVEIMYIYNEVFNGRNFTEEIASAKCSGRVDVWGEEIKD
jgi:hypothetical protein